VKDPQIRNEADAKRVRARRADCLRLIAHDLNNPLTAIRILAEMLRDELTDPDMRRDMIDVLEAADLASAIMDGMSSMLRLEGEEEDYTWFPIDLVTIIQQAVDRPALRRHVKLDLPGEIHLGGDRRALQRAFTDILVNARRLVDGRRMVRLEAERDSTGVTIRVFHPGPGVPAELQPKLLELFGAVDLRKNRVPVAAVGLTYAQYVFQRHGGELTIADHEEGSMVVTVSLKH
jgi:signal transduction histidine kinase